MIRQFSIFILVATALGTGCQNRKSVSTANEVKQTAPDTLKLRTRLGTAAAAFTKDSVILSFTVINEADTAQRFCKWETPFEPRLGKYMEITDVQGNEASFTGAMARRVMPPPPESYIEVPPHDSVRTVFNLAKNYSLSSGEYKARYTGGGVSGLETANEIKITITDHN
jgi:hypothetical protein